MEMVRAIIRPEKEKDVLLALEQNGFVSVTKMHVFGRGKQKGIKVGDLVYDELPKLELMLVVEKKDAKKVCDIIQEPPHPYLHQTKRRSLFRATGSLCQMVQ